MNEPKKDCAYCNGTGVDPNSSNCLCMYGMETPSKKTAPTTVRGWLDTLPEPLKSKAISQTDEKWGGTNVINATQAIGYFADWNETNEGHSYWYGVSLYLRGATTEGVPRLCIEGYNAAKAAYESDENAAYMGVSTFGAMFWDGKEATIAPIFVQKQPTYQVKEVWEQAHDTLEGKTLVDNQLLALLQEKAAKWDELQHTLRRLKIC